MSKSINITKFHMDTDEYGDYYDFSITFNGKPDIACIPYVRFLNTVGFKCYFLLIMMFGSENDSNIVSGIDDYYEKVE